MADGPGLKTRANAIDGWVGSRVKLLRTERGMSAPHLASLIGTTRQQLEKYERGFTKIYPGLLNDMASILEVHPGWFFDGFGAAMQASKANTELDQLAGDRDAMGVALSYRALTAEQRKMIRTMLDAFDVVNELAEADQAGEPA